MKREFNFYISYYDGFRAKDLFPIFSFTKNVQGWSFTRVWSLNWFTYAASFSLIKRSDLNEDRSVAHEKNVKRYMLSKPDPNSTNAVLTAGYCPECGHETVVEDIKWFYGTVKTERCDGLIEVESDKPLEACTWSQELE